jgi:sRNA-binding regulator protein Hfq
MEISELERLRGIPRVDERISPREVELIKYRDNRTSLTVTLSSGETLEGAIRWYDDQAMRLVKADRSEVTVYLHAVAYYRAHV